MFTGIIAAIGHLSHSSEIGSGPRAGRHLQIGAQGLSLHDVAIGDSIAVNGVCLTVTHIDGAQVEFDVSDETLSLTVGLDRTGPVNLEKALRLGDPLGGHLVSGHVDGVGRVVALSPVAESFELVIDAPTALGRFVAYKGSITVQGVSLTVNRVDDHALGCRFWINLIPHTLDATTLGSLEAGASVNLEVDMIARYTERMLSAAGHLTSPG